MSNREISNDIKYYYKMKGEWYYSKREYRYVDDVPYISQVIDLRSGVVMRMISENSVVISYLSDIFTDSQMSEIALIATER